MSSSSESEPSVEGICSELQFIAKELNSFPEILNKSHLPKVKQQKDVALNIIVEKYMRIFGKKIDTKLLLKKINNMKTRLKKKTDVNKTGNAKIKLSEWEKIMFTAMKGESNPTVARIPGAIQCGVPNEDFEQPGSSKDVYPQDSFKVNTPKSVSLPRKKTLLEKYETNETRKLSNIELQRLVLLEQLSTTRAQRNYYNEKLKNLKSNCAPYQNIVNECDKTFYDL